MRKVLLAVLLVLFAVPAVHAQIFDANLNFIVGGQYSFNEPVVGGHRAGVLFSANYPGPKLVTFGDPLNGGTPCYAPGPGFDLRTISPALGDVPGFGLTVGVTCYPKGKQFPIQVGVVQDITGSNKMTGIYFAIGISLQPPQAIAEKRAAKKEGVSWAQWKAKRELAGPAKGK